MFALKLGFIEIFFSYISTPVVVVVVVVVCTCVLITNIFFPFNFHQV